jgi:hypothetical protein
MENFLRLGIVLAALCLSFPGLRAEDATPATEPELTISLPAGLKVETVVTGVSNTFTKLNWIGVVVQNDSVVAFIDHHRVKVKATAVCSGTEIKVFTDYKGESRLEPGEAKANVDRWLRIFERNIRKELGLVPVKGEKK